MDTVFKYFNESPSWRLSTFHATVLIFHMYLVRLLLKWWKGNVGWKVTRALTSGGGLARIWIPKFSVSFYHYLRGRVCYYLYVLIVNVSEACCSHKSIIEKLFIILCQPFNNWWRQFLRIILFLCFFVGFLEAFIKHLWWGNSKSFILIPN